MAEESKPDAPSAQGPPIERTPDFVSLYANHVQVESNAWELTLYIGQFDKVEGQNGVKQRASVTFAWAEAKAVCDLMLTNIAVYESWNGKIPRPRNMKPPLNLPDVVVWRLPSDLEATVKTLLRTPPPPAGDPSTRKQKPRKAKKGRRK